MSKTTPQPKAPLAPEPLPQAGGSYTRQPDGSLLPTQPTPLITPANNATTGAPE